MSQRLSQNKIRVWDLFGEKMITEDVNSYVSVNSDGTFNSWGLEGDNPVMLFTGRQDANGKDMFESDLVLCYDREGGLIYRYPTPIIWVNAMWCVHLAHPAMSTGMMPIIGFSDIDMTIKVVGNVYENPELMEEFRL